MWTNREVWNRLAEAVAMEESVCWEITESWQIDQRQLLPLMTGRVFTPVRDVEAGMTSGIDGPARSCAELID